MKKNTSKSMRNNSINSSSNNAANSRTDKFYGMRKKAGKEIMNQGSTRMFANTNSAYETGAKGDAYGRGNSLKDMPSVGGNTKKQKSKMKSGGSFIEPSKELEFGGVQKYSGGGYPVYAKGSEQSKSFQEAFGKAGRSGKSTFEWEGRKYGTRLAGESDDAYKARMTRNTAGTTQVSAGKGPSQLAGGASSERSLATGPRPTLGSTTEKSAASKKEERSNERTNRQTERQAKPNRKQRKIMKSDSNAKTVDKDKRSAAARNVGRAAAGMKISTNVEPTSYAKRSSGMNMSQIGGKEVNMSAMKPSGTPGSQPAYKPKASGKTMSKPASGRAGRL